MKKLLLLISLLTLSHLTFAQWVAQMHSDVSAKSIAMKTDDAENVYVAGVYSQVLTIFGVGRTTDANTTLTGASTTLTGVATLRFPASNNVFLCKYSKDGVLLWAKSFGQVDTTAEPVRSYLSLQVDGVGNSYLFAYWNPNCTMTGFDCDTRKPGLIKFNPQGDTTWVKYASPASSIFEGYLEKSEKDEELYLNFSATTAFTFGGQAFSSGGKTFVIKADGTQRVVSELPGASPMLVYPCSNVLYKYGNNVIYRDSANSVGRTVLSITGSAKILKLEVDSLGYITGIGKFKDASINVAGQTLTNSRPALVNTSTPGWDVFAFKIKKSGEKVWVKNILSWETGTGNGYIGMAVDGGARILLNFTSETYMEIIGSTFKYFSGPSTDAFILAFKSDGNFLGRFGEYENSIERMNEVQISAKGDLYFSFSLQESENIFSTGYSPLSGIGNGLLLAKGWNGSSAPPPFSTKFLYCNTVTSEPTVPGTNTGIGSFEEKESIQIYPNPSEGAFNISYSGSETLQYTVHSVLGELIEQSLFNEQKPLLLNQKGIYILNIYYKNNMLKKQKIIIY